MRSIKIDEFTKDITKTQVSYNCSIDYENSMSSLTSSRWLRMPTSTVEIAVWESLDNFQFICFDRGEVTTVGCENAKVFFELRFKLQELLLVRNK